MAQIITPSDIAAFKIKRGVAYSFLNKTPSTISVNIIWARPKTTVPNTLSINER